ncbi:Small nuclear ribonucleoprotein family protein [Prunus dulcis]|uniref:Small nuclear ribonucleoprotein family protein n=1 Tax=Prunus dulcis TaxID=3755 RepID=A0A4Y1RC51_PRUDU|nr:Small nuclear ribonucleoprotein family protein [Prunus dulcis]
MGLSVRNCFIRGSVVRYVQLPPEGVDVELLHDATRREARVFSQFMKTSPIRSQCSPMITMEHFEPVPMHILVNILENGDSQDDLCDAPLLS